MDEHAKKILDQNKKVYDIIAPLFAQTRQNLWDDIKMSEPYLKDGISVLDIGCGTGRLYQLFKKFQGVEYIGIDQSDGQIEVAKKEFPEATYMIGEMTELAFDDEQFDMVYCIAAFHHLPNKELLLKSLNEMKRVLKPGGHIIMTNWNLQSDSVKKVVAKGKLKQDGQDFIVPWLHSQGEVLGERYYYSFTPEELEGLFEEVGLEIEKQYYSHKGKEAPIKKPGNIVSVIVKE